MSKGIAKPEPERKVSNSALSGTRIHAGKAPASKARAWQLLPSGVVGKTTDYTATWNLMKRVLDFIQFGGPILTIGRTVFEMWLGKPMSFGTAVFAEVRFTLGESDSAVDSAIFEMWMRL